MEDQEIEYKGISVIVNSETLQDGAGIATFTLHEHELTTPFNVDPIHGATEAEARQKALEEARKEIDKLLFTREIVRSETERRTGIFQEGAPYDDHR
jgi:hypothetical protein